MASGGGDRDSEPPGPASSQLPPPGRPQRGPYVARCQAGKHAWCRCQRSARYPLCDGTHRDSDVTPLKVVFDQPCTVVWCACGRSANAPFCDGSHARLS